MGKSSWCRFCKPIRKGREAVFRLWKMGFIHRFIWRLVCRFCDFIVLISERNYFEIKIMRIIAAKKNFVFWPQMKGVWRTVFLQHWWELILRQLVGWWSVFAAWRVMQRGAENICAPIQFVINPAKDLPSFELKRREAKTRQHNDKNQAIPKLQPPFDGFENFHLIRRDDLYESLFKLFWGSGNSSLRLLVVFLRCNSRGRAG